MGFKNVETFIASGNVIFDTSRQSRLQLENEIEKKLFTALGYETAVFLRTTDELREIAAYESFPKQKDEQAAANNIGFIKEPLSKELFAALKSLETELDEFSTHNTEVYWLCKVRQSQSTFSGNLFERRLKIKVTFRGIKTLQKLSLKYNS